METSRERLLREIVKEIKKKSLDRYNYGGYVFYPNGDIHNKISYNRELFECNTLRMKALVGTMEGGAYVFKEKLDPYLLIDVLNDLRGLSRNLERPANIDWAERIYEEETKEEHGWIKGQEMLQERLPVLKYIRGVEHLPSRCDLTEDFQTHATRMGAWCEEACSRDNMKALEKLIGKWIPSFASRISAK